MLPQSNPEEDEFGEINVFSEERLAKLKERANEEFKVMCEIIKKADGALAGITEFLKVAVKNEHAFHKASKAYVETLKAIESENEKVKL